MIVFDAFRFVLKLGFDTEEKWFYLKIVGSDKEWVLYNYQEKLSSN